jgi:H+/Cl- antiporter ClcA
LLPSSKSPVKSLTIKRDRRSVLLADKIDYCLLIFRSAKTLSIAFSLLSGCLGGRFAPLPMYSTL